MANVKKRRETVKRNPYTAKWNVLFDKAASQWISFKPQEGLNVYPCYACRDMFRSKLSFLDHVNRRGILLTYRCRECSPDNHLTFYNPCSLLLHSRNHYNCQSGQIDLENVSIASLPLGLAGFLPHPDVPMIYDAEENLVEDANLNTRFYNPIQQDQGKRIVRLTPTILMFYHTATSVTPSMTLVLKQISSNIPHCKFILLENNPLSSTTDNIISDGKRKKQVVSNINGASPRISKKEEKEAESVSDTTKKTESNLICCPECKEAQATSMAFHFRNNNLPADADIMCPICKYIAPSECSLKAHLRIHDGAPPYVCPECGKDFPDCETLLDHLDDVCFHLAKQVRYRCPKKNCCKVFAQLCTFVAHFAVHVQVLNRCRICGMYFCAASDYMEHARTIHDNDISSYIILRCTVCKNGGPPFQESDFEKHVQWHCTDRAQCVYVYVCKYCRSFFRSTITYANHLLRCSKKATSGEDLCRMKKSNTATVCSNCNYIIRMVVTISHCPKCGTPFNSIPGGVKRAIDKKCEDEKNCCTCLLCDLPINSEEQFEHIKGNKCRYSNAVVVISRVNPDSPIVELPSPKKKRKKYPNNIPTSASTSSFKQKKSYSPPSSKTEPLQLEDPTPFDGIYHCRLCSHETGIRTEFHQHILQHRDVSTSYQCMECGECFVVKPSLQKHLLYYHQVADFDKYVEENECFDKSAVNELREIMSLAPGESKGPVAENQCRVCMAQFQDRLELDKHFRMHGMAFLLRNSK